MEECRSLGFVTTDLICGACDELDQFNLSTLKESCLKCCQKEDTENEALKVRYRLKFSIFKSFLTNRMIACNIYCLKKYFAEPNGQKSTMQSYRI